MASNIYGAIALIGGTTGALDELDGAALADNDIAIVVVQGGDIYPYVLDATSGASESSPEIIAPDTNPGTKRWLLQNIRSLGIDDNATSKKLDVGDSTLDVLTGANLRAVDGVLFGSDTAAANMLDDYEEGTFTPELWDDSLSGSEGQTYSQQAGFYTKIGNRVFFTVWMTVTSLGTLTTTQNIKIGGLPFTSASTVDSQGSIYSGYNVNNTLSTGQAVAGFVATGVNYLWLYAWRISGGTANMLISHFSSSGSIMVSGHYLV